MRGGSKPGERRGGRQPGTKNKRTDDREKAVKKAAAVIESALPDAFKGDAHAFLMAVYKDMANPMKDRLAAATAAIGYEKPKLAAVEHSGDKENPVTFEIVTGVPQQIPDAPKPNGHAHSH